MRLPFSLAVRLFLLGAVIALVAVVAATWATVNATTVAVQEEQQESLHADAEAYDALYTRYKRLHDHFGRGGDDVLHELGAIRAGREPAHA